ncbi:flagellar biosynthesis protein FliO [Xylophilus rhododendri]|uniref:Flagellar biosynthesis protein FliO n=2 Tax=Xylophilus rhododendri TaxID=2697032 RepID=A0A857JET8_9BURK|nr:flagellar biosynthesis protein FliO [Xylophilus rhododendri]
MTQSLLSVAVFIAVLAMIPWGLRKLKLRNGGTLGGMAGSGSRVVSALGVGPTQRVVTVEVGPPEARVWLVLGVTQQSITPLHNMPAPGFAQAARLVEATTPAAAAAHDYRNPGHA